MSYMLMILEPAGQRAERGPVAGREVYAHMLRFTADLQSRGLLLASASLAPDTTASRVQIREGRKRLLDGPFAETKEMVGGFFLVNCGTREEALAIAAQCPAAQWCTVEVRETGPCYM